MNIRIGTLPGKILNTSIDNAKVSDCISFVMDHINSFKVDGPIDLQKRLNEGKYVVRINNKRCEDISNHVNENDLVLIILTVDGLNDYDFPYPPGTRYGLLKRLYLKLFK